MRIQRFDERFIVRIEAGERVVASLLDFLRREGVGFANLSAAGALRSARIGFWKPDQRAYDYREFDEQLEVVSFVGNASVRDGEPFLHLHVALGRADLSVVGGHLDEAVVHPTIEVWLRTEDVDLQRRRDPATGLDLLDLPDHRQAEQGAF
jgi:predicted DNA-binding protein with PD1-like motif